MVLKSLARKSLSSYSTELLFIEHCGFSTTNVQAQTVISHKDNTILKILQELHFPFCGVEVNPRFYWEHVHALSSAQTPTKEKTQMDDSHKIEADSCISFLQCVTMGDPTEIVSFWFFQGFKLMGINMHTAQGNESVMQSGFASLNLININLKINC